MPTNLYFDLARLSPEEERIQREQNRFRMVNNPPFTDTVPQFAPYSGTAPALDPRRGGIAAEGRHGSFPQGTFATRGDWGNLRQEEPYKSPYVDPSIWESIMTFIEARGRIKSPVEYEYTNGLTKKKRKKRRKK